VAINPEIDFNVTVPQ